MQSRRWWRRRPRLRLRAADERSRFAQYVTRAAHGMDEPLLLFALGLAPQIADIDVERVRRMAEVVAPDSLVDERAREHLTRIAHEELEEMRLRRRQLDAAPVAPSF